MKKGGGGRIVNSTSSSIKQELDNLILSNTFRMGVVGMSKTMAREFGPYNIMVNTMGPGRIYTDRIKYLNTIRAEKAGITLEEYNTRDGRELPAEALPDGGRVRPLRGVHLLAREQRDLRSGHLRRRHHDHRVLKPINAKRKQAEAVSLTASAFSYTADRS